ncbi:MAG: serine--tRNA ligase [Candidatus Omnitrophota bacterium]|nr:serine--tRNA ligase [Candidatus Omnitrophota bacterium]
MLDPKIIRDNSGMVREVLKNRGEGPELIDRFLALDDERKKLVRNTEELKRRKNEASKNIGNLIKEKKDVSAAKEEVKALTEEISGIDSELKRIDEEHKQVLDSIPNIPHETVPVGADADDNRLVKEEGSKPKFAFEAKDHLELGKINSLFDMEKGAKISGSGFPLYTGQGAKLERALINFMLDVHTQEHGYKEIFPPFLVNRASMRGTGQIPKLEADMYRLAEEDMFLIPTAEVPVTNIHAGETLDEADLPIYYTASTACFRREAGSYGKDTKGLIRVHQFNKVEMVKFTRPEDSMKELETLLADAEDILKRLELPYRVIELCTGDISFAAHKCYDIELWAPGTKRWLEVSSCSVFSDFQARRANIRYRPKGSAQKTGYVHTLNGSGVALPRLVIALLEVHQQKDGSVKLPKALSAYFGKDTISPEEK